MKTAELCAGYGGLHHALQIMAGDVELAWYAESDPAPAAIMAHRHPSVANLGDITAVDWAAVKPVDVLAAGFPCQPMSQAGLRRGADDERHLWPTGVQPAIAALRPPVVVLENVPGILTIDRGAVFRAILEDLAQLGYTTRWTTLGACTIGACHHRHRVFALAALAEMGAPDGSLFGAPLASVRKWPPAGHVSDGMLWPLPAQTCGTTGVTLPTPTARDSTRGAGWGDRTGRPLSEVVAMLPTPTTVDAHAGVGAGTRRDGGAGVPNLRTAVTLLPTPGARLGDDRGDPSPDLAATRIDSGRRNLDDAVALLPTPRASDGAKGGPNQRGSSGDLALPAAVQPERWGQYAAAVARHEVMLGRPAPDPTVEGIRGGRRLSSAFVEWIMTLPPGWVTDVNIGRNAQLKALGNGVVPVQAATALRGLGIDALLPEVVAA
jgi:DNA (cytosine-5)-methyltransferase 1